MTYKNKSKLKMFQLRKMKQELRILNFGHQMKYSSIWLVCILNILTFTES